MMPRLSSGLFYKKIPPSGWGGWNGVLDPAAPAMSAGRRHRGGHLRRKCGRPVDVRIHGAPARDVVRKIRLVQGRRGCAFLVERIDLDLILLEVCDRGAVRQSDG